MQAILIECVIRSTLIAAAVGLILFALRIRTAAARHAVWVGVMIAMLLLPALIVWAPKASLPFLPRAQTVSAASVLPPASGHVVGRPEPVQEPAEPLPSTGGLQWAMVGYLLGASMFLIRLGIGMWRVRALFRGTVSCAAPLTVGWLRPKVILPPDSSQWPQAKLDAVLAHEREHVRRRDPLVRWVALLNRAVFWFHPLSWWLERKLSALAEEACDAVVLARGYDPRGYSECLLDLARSVRQAGARVGALGVPMAGIGLERRIRRMLSELPAAPVSRPRIACAAALSIAATAMFGVGALVHAQSGSQGHPEFEAASVRPSRSADPGFKSKDGRGAGLPPTLGRGRFAYSDSLFGMIVRAYGIKGCRPALQADCPLVTGGPGWVKKDRFDIQAKTPEGTPEYSFQQFFSGQAPQIQLMLQALLAGRFGVKVHYEKRRMPVFALIVAKKGPKIVKSGPAAAKQMADDGVVAPRGVIFTAPSTRSDGDLSVHMIVKNSTLQDVADTFSSILQRPVLDRTGLKGEFDFVVKYAADGDQPVAELGGPELFTAFQEQAGLKFEATRAAVDVLIIDHAERPSEN